MVALAYSAVRYVRNQKREQEYREFGKFHMLMRELGTNGTILGNVAVVYELRKSPEYGDLIVRALSDIEIKGSRADMLKRECALTIEHLERSK